MMSLRPGTLLLVLLSVGTSQSVTESWMTSIMDTLLREYRFKGQFCLIANIPATTQPQQLLNILGNDRYQNVLNTIGERDVDNSEVYEGTNVIVARPSPEGHAERRAITRVHLLHHNQQQTGRIFLMYSFLSPCGQHCATMEGDNILEPFQDEVMTHWDDGQYIFVFNTVFNQPRSGRPPTREGLKKPLEALRIAEFRENIFRCFGPTGSFQCHKCFSANQLNNICIDERATAGRQGGNSPTGRQGGNSPTGRQGGNSPTGRQGPSQPKRPRI